MKNQQRFQITCHSKYHHILTVCSVWTVFSQNGHIRYRHAIGCHDFCHLALNGLVRPYMRQVVLIQG